MENAQQGETATLFTEVRTLKTIHNGSVGFVDIGSQTQRFTLFLPELDRPEGLKLKNLLQQRYIADGNDSSKPRRSYLYVTGKLSLYNSEPQMVVTDVSQITDDFTEDSN
jgi:micrococcal nuclease